MPLLVSSCYAQNWAGGWGGGWGGGGWGGGYYASTEAEGFQRGLADVVRSQGIYNLTTAKGNVYQEEANAQYIENRNRAQEVWFDMRRRNDAYRAEKRGPALTSEQIFRINAQRAPKRLNDDQIDPVTGELHWPLLLTAMIYDPYRKIIDTGFEKRSQKGSFSNYESQQEIVKSVESMYDELKKRIRDYEPQEYIDANRFMEALSYDVRFPAN